MKTLLLISAGLNRKGAAELAALEAADQSPRVTLFEKTLNADVLFEEFLENVPPLRRRIYRSIPTKFAQIIEAFLLRNKYDAIVSWAEHLSLPLAALLKLTNSRVPHVAIFSWITKPKKALVLKRVQSHIDRMCIMSSAQREFALKNLSLPAEKVVALQWPVDQKFWRPLNHEPDMISTSGREMRDYTTLLRAIWDLDIRCHIATRVVPWKNDAWRKELEQCGNLPSHISIGYNESIVEVRNYYSRSRFVVLPLLPSDIEVGSTVLLEAMAMGKPVICSKVKGQRDIIEDGKTGLFVPVQNVEALREAILYLWNNPSVAESMGRAARKRVEEEFGLDEWVQKIKSVVEEAIHLKSRP